MLIKLIKELNESLGLTSVVVSHDVPEVMSIADEVYIIANQRVVGRGTPEELRQMQDVPEVEQFIQGLPDGPVPFQYPARPLLEDL